MYIYARPDRALERIGTSYTVNTRRNRENQRQQACVRKEAETAQAAW